MGERNELQELGREIRRRELTLVDRHRLVGLERKIASRLAAGQPSGQLVGRLAESLEDATKRAANRVAAANSMTVAFPPELPLSARAEEIKTLFLKHQVLIVSGSTGSGKTTQLPKIALAADYGRRGAIGCSQPRRLAASSMARRVAVETRSSYGRQVGSKTRFEDNTCPDTVIKFLTDGMLLAETQLDRQLLHYDCLIIDEAHERSLNIDFLLGYVKRLLPRRPDLKIIVSSATLNVEAFSAFFDRAPIVEVEGRAYPVEDYFLPPEEEEDLPSHVARAVEWVTELDGRGDILVFLPGEREISDAADMLSGRRYPNTEILPLYARLSSADQNRVFTVGGRRRIILATNVAETSITIPGVHYVVDSGLVRLSRYYPRTQVQSLQLEQVSQASAKQRRGRCGRVAEGVCVFLYSQEALESSPAFTDPEILRSSLAGVILKMKTLNLPSIEEFPFVDPPRQELAREGLRALVEIGALDQHHELTPEGRDIASFPVDPHLAKALCEANRQKLLPELCVLAAFLSAQDPKERPSERKGEADAAHRQWLDPRSDFAGVLRMWNFLEDARAQRMSNARFRRLCKENYVNCRRVQEWRALADDLMDNAGYLGWQFKPTRGPFENFPYDLLHQCLLAGVPLQIGLLGENKIYQGARERKFMIFPGSCLAKVTPKWVMAFAVVETSQVFARLVAEINPAWVEKVAPALCKSSYADIQWDAVQGFVYALERVSAGGLLIQPGRRVHYGKINPAEARHVFIRDGLAPGNLTSRAPWLKRHQDTVDRIRHMEVKLRRPEALLDELAVVEHFEKVIPPDINNVKDLERWLTQSGAKINAEPERFLLPQHEPVVWDDYPDQLDFEGHHFRLDYVFDPGEPNDGITLICPDGSAEILPDWLADWLVPGHLPEAARLLIRSLPKSLRSACNPAAQTGADFAAAAKNGELNCEQPLVFTLAAFLEERLNTAVMPENFNPDCLPEYLVMKVAEVDRNGKVLRRSRGMPENAGRNSSRLSSVVRGVKEWVRAGLTSWTGPELPESVSLGAGDKLLAYPALTDDGKSVGQQVFMSAFEAEVSHRSGLARLFKLGNPEQSTWLRKHLPISTATSMTLYLTDPDRRFQEDLLDAALHAALTDFGRLPIRSPEAFHAREEAALENLLGPTERLAKALEETVAYHDQAAAGLAALRGESADDLEAQLAFLLRPGFLRDPLSWERCPRHAKALKVRVERARGDIFKDAKKFEEVRPYQRCLDERLDDPAKILKIDVLHEYVWALQDFRVAVFAPELRPFERVSPRRLDELWDKLRRLLQ